MAAAAALLPQEVCKTWAGALHHALAGLAADLGGNPRQAAKVAQWWTDSTAATAAGADALPALPDTFAIWDALMAHRWAASASGGAVHSHYAAHYRLAGGEVPEEERFPKPMPWYFRHTSQYAAFPHAQTMMGVRCSLTWPAASAGTPLLPPPAPTAAAPAATLRR